MLPSNLPDLREKALGLAGLRRVGSDAAGLRAETVFVVGAHGRDSSRNRRKEADMGLRCRSKPCKAKALRKIAARGPSKPWCRNRPPNQCADNHNFQKRPDMVPPSLILPSPFPAVFAFPADNSAGHNPACLDAGTDCAECGNAAFMVFPRCPCGRRKCCRPEVWCEQDRAPERLRERHRVALRMTMLRQSVRPPSA